MYSEIDEESEDVWGAILCCHVLNHSTFLQNILFRTCLHGRAIGRAFLEANLFVLKTKK